MFLRCSYFFQNLSLDVLINKVLIQSNACTAAFPWADRRKGRKDREKPWLDDEGFKELLREKNELYSRKLKGELGEEGEDRLVDVNREVNRTRRRLKKAYFDQRFKDIQGDLRATWEVLGEVLRGRRGRRTGATCGYFQKDGVGVTEGAEIAGKDDLKVKMKLFQKLRKKHFCKSLMRRELCIITAHRRTSCL